MIFVQLADELDQILLILVESADREGEGYVNDNCFLGIYLLD